MLTKQQRTENAKALARTVICSFKGRENARNWLKSYENVKLNLENELDFAASLIQQTLKDRSFDLRQYKREARSQQ